MHVNSALPLCGCLLVAVCSHAATQEEIWKVYQAGDAAKAAQLGVEALQTQPEDRKSVV